MSTSVLIINPFSYPKISSGSYGKFITPMPPIGLAYLLAAVEKSGYSVVFYDDFIEKGNNEKIIKLLKKYRPKIIGLPLYTSPVVYRVQEIVAFARQLLPDSYIVLGNLHANYFAEDILKNKEADVVVLQEGEETIVELVKAIENKLPFENVNGIVFRNQEGLIIKTAPRPYQEDLDKYPFPAWHLMPYKKYNMQEIGKIARTGVFMLSSRGCPYACPFCCLFIQGSKRRTRSVGNICDEIEWLIKKFKYQSFMFIDPTWPINKKEGVNFCQEMIKRGLHKKILWGTETRIDIMDQELLSMMYKAGCRKIMFGIETGSKSTQQSISKKQDFNKTKETIKLAHQEKLDTCGFFMMGFPNETKEDIEKTIDFALSLDLHFAKFAVFVPYPGTPLYEQMLKEGLLDKRDLSNWNSYTTYPTLTNPPVFLDKQLTLKELLELQRKAHLKFYLRPRQLWYAICILRYSLTSIFNSIEFLIINLIDGFLLKR